MAGTQLATTAGTPATIGASEWPIVKEQAEMLVTTGFLPAAIKNANQAVAIMMKGRELGIPPMYALSNIVVIQGKPAANAELMLALIYRDHGDAAIQFVEATNERATIAYKRRGWREYRQHTFTIADAQQAGLTDGNWKKYPAAMLRARCISAVARMAYPDTIAGMYTPEELGANADPETGEIFNPSPLPPAPLGGYPPDPVPHAALRGAPVAQPLEDTPTPPKATLRERFADHAAVVMASGLAVEPLTSDAPDDYVEGALHDLVTTRYQLAYDAATTRGIKLSQPRELHADTSTEQIERYAHGLELAISRDQAAKHGAPAAAAQPARNSGPPATPKQLEAIARLARVQGKTVATEGLSRAQASELLSSMIAQAEDQRPATAGAA